LEQVVTDLLISTDLLQVVLSDLLSLVSNRLVAGCFNKSLRLCCQQLATDLFPQACYRLTKPTDLSRLVDNLPQAGKINRLRQACEISGCVQHNAARLILDLPRHSYATEALENLEWKLLYLRRKYHRCISVFKCLNHLVDFDFNLTMISYIHSHKTRQKNNYYLPCPRTNWGKTAVHLSLGIGMELITY
jgi:hypothetical protein